MRLPEGVYVKFHREQMLLGKGTYGTVRLEGNKAVKQFARLSHLVQEYVALRYLRHCRYVVKPIGVDFETLSISMELCDCSLKQFLEDDAHYDGRALHQRETRRQILKDVLSGLAEIHGRGLVHGDLKPGNILLYKNPLKCIIGDLGFVSVAPYAKVERTAPAYRDCNVRKKPSHDMYSLGVLLLELEGNLKIDRQGMYGELHDLVLSSVRDKTMRALILSLLDRDHQRRPQAKKILKEMFGVDISVSIPSPPNVNNRLSDKQTRSLKDWMRSTSGIYDIHRAKRGYKGTIYFLNNYTVPPPDYQLCACTMLMILSSLFGASGFNEELVLKVTKRPLSDVHDMLEALVESDGVVSHLLS